jgi:membrane protein
VFFPLWGWSNIAIEFLRWSVVLTVFLVGFAIIYKLGPNLGSSYPHRIIPGALFAAFGWVLSSTGFSIYLQNFSNYEQVYGSIGAVVVMLLWLFISAYLVLLGGALNVALTRRKPAIITTVVSSARAKL